MDSDGFSDHKPAVPARAACLSAAEVDDIVHGVEPHAEVAAHLSRCQACADAVGLARFTSRFTRVMSVDHRTTASPTVHHALPDIFGYRCLNEIARGGQGIVYRAMQETTGREVAIKVLHANSYGRSRQARERMAREIEIASLLDHPGLVQIFDSVKMTDGRDALVMELVQGDSLLEWVRLRPWLTERERLVLLASIADAAHHAHQLGVIHRDLKPSNVLVDPEGRPRLLDFGIASRLRNTPADRRLTMTGEFAGTIAYAAPEQVSSDKEPVDIRTDVYALGVIGYELLTGHLPYSIDGALQSVIERILTCDIPPCSGSGLTRDAWTVLAKATAKDKYRRYQSAADFANDLRTAASGGAIAARADSRWYVIRKSAARHRVPLSLAAVICMGAAATLVALAFGNARLNEALNASRLLQIHAHLAAGSREQAERVLWHEIEHDLNPARDPIEMLWAGSHREKQLMWSFVKMQSLATCIRIEPEAASAQVGVWPLAGGGFVYARSSLAPAILDDRGETISIARTPIGVHTGHRVRIPPSGDVLIQWTDASVETTSLETGQHLASFPTPSRPLTLAHAEWGLAIAQEDGRISVVSLPDLRPMLDVTDALPGQTPWLGPTHPALAYITHDAQLQVLDVLGNHDRPHRAIDVLPATGSLLHPQLLLSAERDFTVIADGSGVRVLGSSADSPVLFEHLGARVWVGHDPAWNTISTTAHGDPTLHLWETRTWRSLGGLPGHKGAIVSHAFSNTGDRVVTVDHAGTLRVWQSPAAGWQHNVGYSNTTNHQIEFDHASGFLHTPADIRTTFQQVMNDATPATEPRSPSRIAISPDGRWMIAADMFTVAGISTTQQHDHAWSVAAPNRIVGLRFQPGQLESHVAVCLESAVIITLDPSTGSDVRTLHLGTNAIASDLAWSPSGHLGAVSLRDGTIAVFDHNADVRIMTVTHEQLRSLAFLPGGKTMATVGDSGKLHLVDVASGRVRESAQLSEHSLFCVVIHPQGGIAVIGDRDGVVRAVDLISLTELAAFDAGGSVMSLAFDRDGKRVGVSALEQPTQVWDFNDLAGTYRTLWHAVGATR